MPSVRVTITRYLSDEPQPGMVECELLDIHGRGWRFHLKTPYVSANLLDSTSVHPQPGSIEVEIVQRRRDAAGRDIVQIDTERPWDLESLEGHTRFEIAPHLLEES